MHIYTHVYTYNSFSMGECNPRPCACQGNSLLQVQYKDCKSQRQWVTKQCFLDSAGSGTYELIQL